MCARNCTEDTTGFLYEIISNDVWLFWNEYSNHVTYNPWVFSLLGSTMVGLAGILPLLVIPIEEGADLKNGASAGTLKILLSFAVGGLLGDVFLHLLPEAWDNDLLKRASSNPPSMPCGLWVLSGFLVFVIVEKIFAFDYEPEVENDSSSGTHEKEIIEKNKSSLGTLKNIETEKEMENNNCITMIGTKQKNGYLRRCIPEELSEVEPFLEKKPTKNGYLVTSNGVKETRKNGYVKSDCPNGIIRSDSLSVNEVRDCLKRLTKSNGFTNELSSLNGCLVERKRTSSNTMQVPRCQTSADSTIVVKDKSKRVAGYLNLLANCIDNFTHGLAVGGSFLMSFRLGALTTFAILVHEIPHEVGDFAILLQSGFSRWDAARAQLFTATGGIFGSMAAIFFSGGEVEARTNWILPFTAGGFLHIGLVTILPDLLKESSPKESLKQLGALLFGITLMAILTILCD